MKVYIYMAAAQITVLNGLLADPAAAEGTDFVLHYYWQNLDSGTLLVSIGIDDFVYLQDAGLLKAVEII